MTSDVGLKKKFLIIGGDSSLGIAVANEAGNRDYSVLTTTRRKLGKNSVHDFYLDLSENASIDAFLELVSEEEFDSIAIFTGAPSKHFDAAEEYVRVHLINALRLTEQLVLRLNPRRGSWLALISSRSALYPSRDVMYSTVKGGLISGLRSISLFCPGEAIAVTLAPGLIEGSTMAIDMGSSLVENHKNRANGKLLEVTSFAHEFISLLETLDPRDNGKCIEIGPSYL